MAENKLKRRSAAEYQAMLTALLPRGAAWSRSLASVLSRLLGASSEELARLDADVHLLPEETNPATAVAGLEDFERVLGLPDSCLPSGDTLQERRDAVLAKLGDSGREDIAYWYQLAATLGFEVTIEEHWPFVCGIHECGDPSGLTEREMQDYPEIGYCAVPEVRYWLNVIVHGDNLILFRCGESECGELLMDWRTAASLECVMRRDLHAHILPTFEYREE